MVCKRWRRGWPRLVAVLVLSFLVAAEVLKGRVLEHRDLPSGVDGLQSLADAHCEVAAVRLWNDL